MSKLGKWHRLLGLFLLLPFLGWISTATIFYVKPGYSAAYGMLSLKSYPITDSSTLALPAEFDEIRILRTTLGTHLLVDREDQRQHLSAQTGQNWPEPAAHDLRRLIDDAITTDPGRYGVVASTRGLTATTTTGVQVTLDWTHLRLTQRGADTEWINALYRIHYLQWTGITWFDATFGGIALLAVLLLSVMGVRMAFDGDPKTRRRP